MTPVNWFYGMNTIDTRAHEINAWSTIPDWNGWVNSFVDELNDVLQVCYNKIILYVLYILHYCIENLKTAKNYRPVLVSLRCMYVVPPTLLLSVLKKNITIKLHDTSRAYPVWSFLTHSRTRTVCIYFVIISRSLTCILLTVCPISHMYTRSLLSAQLTPLRRCLPQQTVVTFKCKRQREQLAATSFNTVTTSD